MTLQNKVFKSSFIRSHILRRIFTMCTAKKKILNVPDDTFVFFNQPLKLTDKIEINRFGKGNFYQTDEILPVSWNLITGSFVYMTFQQIKANRVFVLKKINGKYYRTKTKENYVL